MGQEERVAFAIGSDRKKRLLEISAATGHNLSNLLRGWVVEKIKEYDGQ